MLEFLIGLIVNLMAMPHDHPRWRWFPVIVATLILLAMALISWWAEGYWGALLFLALAAILILVKAIYFRFIRRRCRRPTNHSTSAAASRNTASAAAV